MKRDAKTERTAPRWHHWPTPPPEHLVEEICVGWAATEVCEVGHEESYEQFNTGSPSAPIEVLPKAKLPVTVTMCLHGVSLDQDCEGCEGKGDDGGWGGNGWRLVDPIADPVFVLRRHKLEDGKRVAYYYTGEDLEGHWWGGVERARMFAPASYLTGENGAWRDARKRARELSLRFEFPVEEVRVQRPEGR